MKTPWLTMGAIFGGLAVAIGAFAAHGLKQSWGADSPRLDWVETGAKYQMYHSLALVGLGLIAGTTNRWSIWMAGVGFTLGILLFSGSLYLLAFTEVRWLGAITPIGGVGLLVGWTGFALSGILAARSAPIEARS